MDKREQNRGSKLCLAKLQQDPLSQFYSWHSLFVVYWHLVNLIKFAFLSRQNVGGTSFCSVCFVLDFCQSYGISLPCWLSTSSWTIDICSLFSRKSIHACNPLKKIFTYYFEGNNGGLWNYSLNMLIIFNWAGKLIHPFSEYHLYRKSIENFCF